MCIEIRLSVLLLADLYLADGRLSGWRHWWSATSPRWQPGDCKFLAFSWFKDLEGTHQALIDCHHGTRIVEFTAIVGSREDGDELSPGKELVAILDDLMRATNQVQVVSLEETGDDVRAKGEGDAAFILTPPRDILVRI